MEKPSKDSFIPDFPQPRQASRFMNPFTDMGFKRIFGQEANKDLLLDFLNELLEGEDRIADVQFLDKEIIRGNEQKRGIIYDVFCRTADGKYLIIEMQASSQKAYRERAIYYSGKALSRQGTPGEGWDFDQLAAVYSINFLNFVLLGKFRSDIFLMDRDTQQVFSTKQRFIFLEFPLFRKKEQECKTDFERWIYILKHMETLNRIPFQPMKAIFERLAKVTNVESLTPDERYAYERDLKAYRDYKAQMDYAIEEGFDKGMRKGMKEGIEKGIEKEKLRNAKAMKAKGYPVNDIADITGLPIQDIEKL